MYTVGYIVNYSGRRGSRLTLVPPSPPVSEFKLVAFSEVGLDLEDLEDDFLFNFWGRICSLGLSSVPEFSADNW